MATMDDTGSQRRKGKEENEEIPLDEVVGESTVDYTVYAALPPELSMFTNPSSLLDALWLFLNWTFFLFLFPFRLSRDKTFRHIVVKHRIHQIICGITHVLFMIYFTKKFRSNTEVLSILSGKPSESQSQTKDYFQLVLAIAEISYVMALLWTAWTKASVFQRLSNTYYNLAKFEDEQDVTLDNVDDRLPMSKLIKAYTLRLVIAFLQKRYVVGLLLLVVYTGLGFHDWFDEYYDEIINERELWGEFGYIKNATKIFFFIEESSRVPGFIIEPFTWIYLMISLQYSLIISLGNLFFGILALMLANLGNNFEDLLKLPDATTRQVLAEYEQTKTFVKYINEKFGLLTLFLVISAVPYYATTLPSVLNKEIDLHYRVCVAINLIHYALVLYLTSTLNEKMKTVTDWFAEREKAMGETGEIDIGVSSEQQRIMAEELGKDSMALSAFGFFAVTYSTIGKILQLLMTYGFIVGETSFASQFANMTSSITNSIPIDLIP